MVDARDRPGLDEIIAEYWPSYRSWMKRAPRLESAQGRRMLTRFMPELLDRYDALLERWGGGAELGRFLSLYNPPPLVRGCTQLIVDEESGPALLRAYDHHPRLFDGVILASEWDGVATLALTDCAWGALDGVNEHGLAIALAFGGRNALGDGFAAPLICRHVLQSCRTVSEARAVLARVPVYMPYTFAVVDSSGDFVTAFLGPDRPPSFVKRRASANHQGAVEWDGYAAFTQSELRLAAAESLIGGSGPAEAFLSPPVWRHEYAKGSGTLYVAQYSTVPRTLTLHWPGRSERLPLGGVDERLFSVTLPERPVTPGGSAPTTQASGR